MKHADFLGAIAARRLKVPMVSTLHLIEDAPTPLGRVKRSLAAQARLRGASRTVAVSDAVREWYLQQFSADPTRVVTIPNGRTAPAQRSAADRQQLRAELGLAEPAIAVAVVGIMRPGKGHAAVIEVARRLAQSRMQSAPPIHFLLAGDGPLRGELEAQAERAGVAGDVTFLGYRDDVAAVLHASDILLHASDFDALPTVLIEGLAAGVPAVAYAVGGVPEIVTRDTGYVVDHGDMDALGAAITKLATDPDGRAELGRNGKARFTAEFDASTWAGRLRDLYAELTA
jgi:glycosyltransferase involved in cell wall biosynthesis